MAHRVARVQHLRRVTLTVNYDEGGEPPEGDGFTVTNLSGAKSSWKYYTIDVPRRHGRAGDRHLRRQRRQPICTSAAAPSPPPPPTITGRTSTATTRTVTVNNPTAGTWYIGIRAYAAYSGLTLDAYYFVTAP